MGAVESEADVVLAGGGVIGESEGDVGGVGAWLGEVEGGADDTAVVEDALAVLGGGVVDVDEVVELVHALGELRDVPGDGEGDGCGRIGVGS